MTSWHYILHDISEVTSNSQGILEQGEVNTDQDQSEVLPEVLNQINPENRNLGEERAATKYNLRLRPERNKRYYATELEADCKNNLRGVTDSKNMHIRPILKAHLSPKLTNSQQIAILETLPKCHLTALRAGFLLQRELSLPIVNNTMAEFLYRGKFSDSK